MHLLAAQTGTIEHVRSQFDCTVSHEFVGDGLSAAKKVQQFQERKLYHKEYLYFF